MNLTELQKVDPETWDAIMLSLAVEYAENKHLLISEYSVIGRDIIQGCLQRAIEKRGWGFALHLFNNPNRYSATVCRGNNGDWAESPNFDSPAKALLAAYLEAIHER